MLAALLLWRVTSGEAVARHGARGD